MRETENWESWVTFFLKGVADTADQATQTARAIIGLFEKDRVLIENTGKSGTALWAVYQHFQHHPVSNTTRLRKQTQKSLPTILRSLAVLEELGIIKEVSGKERHKVFHYPEYLDTLSKGTEPLAR